MSEAREFHTTGTRENVKRQKAGNASSSKGQPGGFVPDGAGGPAVKDQAMRQEGKGKKGKGKGEGNPQAKRKAKGPGKGKGKAPDYVSDDSGSDAGSQKSGRSSKSGRSNASSAGGGGNRQQPCRFFKNGTGCSRGVECPFRHGQLKPTDGQCFNCGSKSHSKAECPHPKVKPGNRKGSIGSEAGGRPAGESDADAQSGQPQNHRQLESFLETMFQAAQQFSSSTSGQRNDPMVKICHLSSDCGEVWPTPHPAVNQEEAYYVQKCADRCSC